MRSYMYYCSFIIGVWDIKNLNLGRCFLEGKINLNEDIFLRYTQNYVEIIYY